MSEITHRFLHATTSGAPFARPRATRGVGIHCCPGSGYSLARGPHPALLALRCSSEQGCLLTPGSLTLDIKTILLEKSADERPPPHPPDRLKAGRARALGPRATPS